MPKSPITSDVHETFDVHGDLFAKVAFDSALRVDDPADLADVLLGELFHLDFRTDPRLFQDELGAYATDSVDMGKSDIDALVAR
jgi:hypothetical protein